jgi:hypothetical protein
MLFFIHDVKLYLIDFNETLIELSNFIGIISNYNMAMLIKSCIKAVKTATPTIAVKEPDKVQTNAGRKKKLKRTERKIAMEKELELDALKVKQDLAFKQILKERIIEANKIVYEKERVLAQTDAAEFIFTETVHIASDESVADYGQVTDVIDDIITWSVTEPRNRTDLCPIDLLYHSDLIPYEDKAA